MGCSCFWAWHLTAASGSSWKGGSASELFCLRLHILFLGYCLAALYTDLKAVLVNDPVSALAVCCCAVRMCLRLLCGAACSEVRLQLSVNHLLIAVALYMFMCRIVLCGCKPKHSKRVDLLPSACLSAVLVIDLCLPCSAARMQLAQVEQLRLQSLYEHMAGQGLSPGMAVPPPPASTHVSLQAQAPVVCRRTSFGRPNQGCFQPEGLNSKNVKALCWSCIKYA
jgi:hypothetical protein